MKQTIVIVVYYCYQISHHFCSYIMCQSPLVARKSMSDVDDSLILVLVGILHLHWKHANIWIGDLAVDLAVSPARRLTTRALWLFAP